MTAKAIAVKKYVVRLSEEERGRLLQLISKGKSSAKQQLKARILLKADVSGAGEGRSDGRIIRGSGDQRIDGLPGTPTAGGGGLRGGLEPQGSRDAGHSEDFR
jgi:hypothetical protein